MGRYAGLDSHLSSAERKQKLLMEGALFRAEMMHSRDIVRANLNTRSLATVLLGRASSIATSLIGTSSALKASNLPAMLPLLVTGVSWLSKRAKLPKLKPLLIGAAAILAIGGGVFVSSRNNKEATDDE